jgi:hypothetical protein
MKIHTISDHPFLAGKLAQRADIRRRDRAARIARARARRQAFEAFIDGPIFTAICLVTLAVLSRILFLQLQP